MELRTGTTVPFNTQRKADALDRFTAMKLSTQFWTAYKGSLLVRTDGAIGFTAAGRKKFAKPMAQSGFSISNVRTVERFLDIMDTVSAVQLEENTAEMIRLLNAPETTETERAMLKRVLGIAA